ncbi:MAG: hypothetical protein MUD05_08820 [Candidatus Nanopelagicales bacterium]|jgi:hypothetical protein|nr:hypothetical protein [Candidatus Nanopelagicales bacterium]
MDAISLQHFTPLLGQRFDLELEPGRGMAAELAEATALQSPGLATRREAFSLMFKGPAQPLLPQSTYRVTHEAGCLPPMDIFIVPVRGGADAVWYEAVFT